MQQTTFYESTFIMRQDIAAQEAHKVAEKFAEVVASMHSEVIKREYWGLRTLAYIVRKNKRGHYMMFGLKASDEAVKELERRFKISEDVIKFFTVRVDKIDLSPSPMLQAPADNSNLSASAVGD